MTRSSKNIQKLIPWQMSRPEPTTGTASGTAFYDDATTPLTEGTARTMNKADGSVGEEKALENGNFKEERPAGEYTIQIINNGEIVGSIDVTIVVGVDLEGQNVTTNGGLIFECMGE